LRYFWRIIMASEPTNLPSTLLTSNRRGYLQTLALLVGGAAAVAKASAATAIRAVAITAAPPPVSQRQAQADAAHLKPNSEPALQRVLLQKSPIAGFQYHDGEAVWASLRAGDALELVREASNRYDERAVRLEWNGQKIGYVPAADNAAVSQLMDRDACLDAVITALHESHNPWDRVEFAVYLTVANGD
jgi:HIRAN domain